MALPKTKAQIIANVADAAEITKAQAKAAIDQLIAVAYKGAKDKKGFTIPDSASSSSSSARPAPTSIRRRSRVMKFPARRW